MTTEIQSGNWVNPNPPAPAQKPPRGEVGIVVANLRPGDKQKLSLDVEALGHDKWSKRDIDVPKLGTLDLGVVRLGARPVVRVNAAGIERKSAPALASAR